MVVVVVVWLSNTPLFSTRNKVPPTALVWCGMESVVCHWEGLLLMVSACVATFVLPLIGGAGGAIWASAAAAL